MKYNSFDIYLIRKRYCIQCSTLLKRNKVVRIIDAKSKEARQYTVWEGSGDGDIELTTYNLLCPVCNTIFSPAEHEEWEKQEKKRKKQERKQLRKKRN